MKISRVLSIVFSVVALLVAGNVAAQDDMMTKVDYSAEQLRAIASADFAGLDGNRLKVSDYKGKVVILDFWETWCAPCLETFPVLAKLSEEYPEDFVVLAISPGLSDSRKKVKAFVEEKGYDFRFAYGDEVMDLITQLEAYGLPFKVFIDAEGNYVTTVMGAYSPEHDYKEIKSIIEANKKG